MARSKKAQAAIDDALSISQAQSSVGLGVDLVEVDRMEQILGRTPSFKEKVFSEEERAYCDRQKRPAMHYAARFAAKEAVVKALGCGFTSGVSVRDVEVRRSSVGRPEAVLTGRAQEVASEQGVTEIPLSLSHTRTDAIACAMALTADAAKKQVAKVSAADELARKFKETRSLLDELDAGPEAQSSEAKAAEGA